MWGKSNSYFLGLWAEAYCALILRLKGHNILNKRVKTPLGEIDLITTRSGITYIFEVKYRSSGLDDAKIALLLSRSRICRAVSWLRFINVEYKYFIVSGFRYKVGDLID